MALQMSRRTGPLQLTNGAATHTMLGGIHIRPQAPSAVKSFVGHT
jgi:hypothetical protein